MHRWWLLQLRWLVHTHDTSISRAAPFTRRGSRSFWKADAWKADAWKADACALLDDARRAAATFFVRACPEAVGVALDNLRTAEEEAALLEHLNVLA